MVEWNEDILIALKREVKEEIGVEITKYKFTGKYYDKIERHPTKTVICLPHICQIKKEPKCISECDEIKWCKKDEVQHMILAYDHRKMLIDYRILKRLET